jgi:hypothetical protein
MERRIGRNGAGSAAQARPGARLAGTGAGGQTRSAQKRLLIIPNGLGCYFIVTDTKENTGS